MPNDMFGKVMSIPDDLIMDYFVHCTRVPMSEIAKMAEDIVTGGNPRDAKARLAKEIVALYHGEEAAEKAEAYFVETFSEKKTPKHVEAYEAHENVLDFMVSAKLASSKSEARRLIQQNGVSIDGEKVVVGELILSKELHDGKIMKVGHRFVKIVF